MTHRFTAILMVLWLQVGCTPTAPKPPVIATSTQPAMRPVDAGYIACATALYGSYRPWQLNLRPAYQSGLVADGEYRLFRLSGWVYEDGKKQQAHFECLTDPSRQATVRGLTRLSSLSGGFSKR